MHAERRKQLAGGDDVGRKWSSSIGAFFRAAAQPVATMLAQLACRDTRGAMPHRRIMVPGRAGSVSLSERAGRALTDC